MLCIEIYRYFRSTTIVYIYDYCVQLHSGSSSDLKLRCAFKASYGYNNNYN